MAIRVLDCLKLVCGEIGLDEVKAELVAYEKSLVDNATLASGGDVAIADAGETQNESAETSENGVAQGDGALAEANEQGASGEFVFSAGVQTEIDRLIDAINSVAENISAVNCPIVKSENVQSDAEGKVSLDDFSGEVLQVLNCTDVSKNQSVDFLLLPFHLYLPSKNTKYFVVYRASAEKSTSLTSFVEVGNVVTLTTLAKGVASEYLFGRNCYEEAVVWRDRFETELANLLVKNTRRMIKPRPLY